MRPGGDVASALLADRAQRRLIYGLLLLILIVAGVMFTTDELFVGAPNSPFTLLLVAVLAGTGYWLAWSGRLRLAVGVVNGCFFVAVAGPLLIHGLEAAQGLLPLVFVPLALASLVLTRAQTTVTAVGIIVVFLLSLLLQQQGLTLAPSGLSPGAVAIAGQFLTAYVVLWLILDRFGRATAAALATSQNRERELVAEMELRKGAEAALQDEQNFSNAVIASLPGVFFVLNRKGQVVGGNSLVVEATGYTEEQVRSMPLHEFIGPAEQKLMAQKFEEAFRRGDADASLHLKRADGQLVPYLFRARRFMMNREQYIAGLGYDVSRIVAAEQSIQALNANLERQVERLTALREIDMAISHGSGPADTIRVILEQVTMRLGIDAAAVQRFDAGANVLRWERGAGFHKDSDALELVVVRLGQGLSGTAALERQAVYVHGEEELEQRFTNWNLVAGEGFRFYVAVPLLANGLLEGVLSLFHRSDFEPDQEWRDFVDALGSQVALALNSARLLQGLQDTNRELLRAYDTTIEGWSRALDLRDEETEGHSRRVSELTVELARRMGAPPERLEHIRRGALLHDIGKMGVPDSILLKPGRLDDEERRLMEQHPVYARELLEPIPFLQPALAIPYSHHENWDGSGYPEGLAGEEIPLAARLFSVIDVFDALTSDRPYRAAWPADRAISYIREQAGRKFDPRVVAEFTAMMQETADRP